MATDNPRVQALQVVWEVCRKFVAVRAVETDVSLDAERAQIVQDYLEERKDALFACFRATLCLTWEGWREDHPDWRESWPLYVTSLLKGMIERLASQATEVTIRHTAILWYSALDSNVVDRELPPYCCWIFVEAEQKWMPAPHVWLHRPEAMIRAAFGHGKFGYCGN